MLLLRKSRSLWESAFFAFLISVDVEGSQSKTSEGSCARSSLDHWLTSLEKIHLKDIKNSAWLYRIIVVNESSLTLNIHSWGRSRMYDRDRCWGSRRSRCWDSRRSRCWGSRRGRCWDSRRGRCWAVDETGAEAVDGIRLDSWDQVSHLIDQTNACVLVRCKFHSHRLNENVGGLGVCGHLRFLAHKTVFSASEAQAGESRCLVWG